MIRKCYCISNQNWKTALALNTRAPSTWLLHSTACSTNINCTLCIVQLSSIGFEKQAVRLLNGPHSLLCTKNIRHWDWWRQKERRTSKFHFILSLKTLLTVPRISLSIILDENVTLHLRITKHSDPNYPGTCLNSSQNQIKKNWLS